MLVAFLLGPEAGIASEGAALPSLCEVAAFSYPNAVMLVGAKANYQMLIVLLLAEGFVTARALTHIKLVAAWHFLFFY